jgi:RNA polymerase sigma-70 factor (ECF subfamily)
LQITKKTTSSRDIDQLVKKAVDGNADAFVELYDIHVDRIYRHIYYRVGNTNDAEDLTQQVFIKAWQAIRRYRKKSVPFVAWLMTISRNLMIDFYRAHKEKVSLNDESRTISHETRPEHLAEVESEYQQLIENISRLPEEQRRVIIMRFIDGSSYEEIAANMNKSKGAIRVILHRGLKKMRALMEEGIEKT